MQRRVQYVNRKLQQEKGRHKKTHISYVFFLLQIPYIGNTAD